VTGRRLGDGPETDDGAVDQHMGEEEHRVALPVGRPGLFTIPALTLTFVSPRGAATTKTQQPHASIDRAD
jgi:hypothetical protein